MFGRFLKSFYFWRPKRSTKITVITVQGLIVKFDLKKELLWIEFGDKVKCYNFSKIYGLWLSNSLLVDQKLTLDFTTIKKVNLNSLLE